MDTLRGVAAAAFILSAVALTWQARHALRLGRQRVEAPARGDAGAGVAHAFGRGMSPWAKESVRQHLGVYATGILYHLGIFTSLGLALLAIVGVPRPAWVGLAAAPLLAGSLASGVAMLLRRLATPGLRAISSPDDVASNLVVSLLVLAALVSVASGGSTASLLLSATMVVLYAPLGKIRHCVFFFLARTQYGRLMGHRGVLPRPAHGARS